MVGVQAHGGMQMRGYLSGEVFAGRPRGSVYALGQFWEPCLGHLRS